MIAPELDYGGKHGFPNMLERHWGDLGNFNADPDGNGTYNRFDQLITLQGIVGRGMTVHEGPDLGAQSQPSGGSGARVGFCVIGFANIALI